MFSFGIDPKVAVATNMFGLTFMSIGASIPFTRKQMIDYRKVFPLILVTLIASTLGAIIVILIEPQSIKFIVSIAMIAVASFILIDSKSKTNHQKTVSSKKTGWITILLTFLLGIYGGVYSGGYVTILTAVYVAFSGMSFSESVATTKLINVFSSLVATLVFIWQGLVDYKLGIILALTMFIGAYIGALFATKLNESILKRIFVATVFILAIKTFIDAL